MQFFFGKKIPQVLVHSGIYLLITTISGFISILIFPILARYLSVQEFGKYDVFIILLSTFTPLASFGISTGLGTIAHTIPTMEKLCIIIRQVLKLQFIPIAIISLLLIFSKITGIFQTFSYQLIIILILAIAGLSSITIISSLFIWKEMPIRSSITIHTGWKLGTITGILALIFTNTHTSTLYLLALSLSFIITALTTYIFWIKPKVPKTIPPSYTIQNLIKLSFPYGISKSLFSISTGIEKFIILKKLGPYLLGIYSLSDKIAFIPRMLGEAALLAIIPALVKTKETKHFLLLTISIFLIYSLTIIFLGYNFRTTLVYIFGGKKYISATKLITPALINETLILFPSIINTILLKQKQTYAILIYTLTSIFITILLSLVLINNFQIYGCIYASILGKICGIVALLLYLLLPYQIRRT